MLAYALAGVGHLVLFGAFLLLYRASHAEPDVECVIEMDAGQPGESGGAGAGPVPGPGASPAGAAESGATPVVPAPPTRPPERTETPGPTPPVPVIPVVPVSAVPVAPAVEPPVVVPPAPVVKSSAPVGSVVTYLAAKDGFTPGASTKAGGAGAASASSTGSGAGAGGSGAGTSVGAGAGSPGGSAPQYRRRVAPDYPSRARKQRLAGDVVLRIHISPTGEPVKVEVEKSSGHRLLDEAACDAALASDYVPARREGRPVPSVAMAPVSFKLQGN